ncbi:MAG: HAMP domain-containing protein [Bacteriovoracaceae bacterium]|nr:HAMP domain-containing protein [Bacteriovoracaceae bacterium]
MKVKILSLLILLLLVSVGAYVFFAIEMFYSDKTSYIYETSLTRAESLSQLTLNTINNSSKDSLSLALISNTNPKQLQELLNTDPNILMFVAFNKSKQGLSERIRVLNETVWDELELQSKIKKEDIFKKKIEDLIPKKFEKNSPIQIFSSSSNLKIPSISMVVSNPKASEYYLCVLSISKIIDQFKKDKVYTNELLDNQGLSYLDDRTHSNLIEILKGNIPKGTKEIVDAKGIESLVSFVKIPSLNMTFFTTIKKEKAFLATKTLISKSLYFGILLLAICIFLGVLFSASITRPINALVRGTQFIANGDYEQEIQIKTNDELGLLSASFNFMSGEINSLLKSKEVIIEELREAKEKIEDYSKNLEVMVSQRTQELKEANDFLDTMINSLDQGLMVFDKDNLCHDVYTKACEDMFEISPGGNKFSDVLGFKESKEVETFNKWSKNIFDEKIPFEHLTPLGPQNIQEGSDFNAFDFKYIGLQYFPMRNEDNKIENIVAVATNKTSEVQAKEAFKQQESYVNMILKLVNNKKQFVSYIEEFKSLVQDMAKYLDDSENAFNSDGILICLHSIKGGAGLFSVQIIQDKAHLYENEVIEVKEKSLEERLAFVPRLKSMIQDLQDSFHLFLLESKEIIGNVIDSENQVLEINKTLVDKFNTALIGKDDSELIDLYHEYFIREPIINYFSAYSDLVKDVSESLGKSVSPLVFKGGDTRIEYSKHKELFGVMVHAFRNSVDHGIESEGERIESGKPPEGKILVNFSQDEKNLNIEISDDGRGIDPEKIREKLSELGLESDLDDSKVIYCIFDTEFSTSEGVTEISGRGVGMSAIKEAIEKVGGSIEVESKVGECTIFRFTVPA